MIESHVDNNDGGTDKIGLLNPQSQRFKWCADHRMTQVCQAIGRSNDGSLFLTAASKNLMVLETSVVPVIHSVFELPIELQNHQCLHIEWMNASHIYVLFTTAVDRLVLCHFSFEPYKGLSHNKR